MEEKVKQEVCCRGFFLHAIYPSCVKSGALIVSWEKVLVSHHVTFLLNQYVLLNLVPCSSCKAGYCHAAASRLVLCTHFRFLHFLTRWLHSHAHNRLVGVKMCAMMWLETKALHWTYRCIVQDPPGLIQYLCKLKLQIHLHFFETSSLA